MCANFVPDITLSSLHTLSHLISIMALQDRHCDSFHFIEAESFCHFSRVMELLNDKTGIPTRFHVTPSLTRCPTPWHYFRKKKMLFLEITIIPFLRFVNKHTKIMLLVFIMTLCVYCTSIWPYFLFLSHLWIENTL